MRKERASHLATGPALVDWDALIDPADETERQRRVRQFEAVIRTFRSDPSSGEPPRRQLARQIHDAAAHWR